MSDNVVMRSQESMEYSMPRITVSRCMYETGIATSSDACIYHLVAKRESGYGKDAKVWGV